VVVSADGNFGIVDALVITDGTAEVYNLTVDEAHTYFVGDGAWLVHNACHTHGNNNIDYRRRKSTNDILSEAPDGTVRVGRWMGQTEYDDMITTGKVQERLGGTYGSLNGSETFRPQNPNHIYVEFDIPASSPWWLTNDRNGWIVIITPGSTNATTWELITKRSITEMPTATQIVKVK